MSGARWSDTNIRQVKNSGSVARFQTRMLMDFRVLGKLNDKY
jgi:hypothetical protein